MELTPPVPRYEQVAYQLRQQIFSGDPPEGEPLPSAARIGAGAGVSQNTTQKALEILEREGLLSLRAGSGSTVLCRSRWRVEFAAAAPGGGDDVTLGGVRERLAVSAGMQPAVSGAVADRDGAGRGIRVRMTVESADLGGAVVAALPVASHAFGGLPVVRQSAEAC